MLNAHFKNRPLAHYALLMTLFLTTLILIGGCQSKVDKPTEKYPLPSEKEIKKLKSESATLLSSTESKIVSSKIMQIDKLDTYGLPENTLGTLKQMVAESEGKVENLVAVEGVRENKEKVYVLWQKDKDGKWKPYGS